MVPEPGRAVQQTRCPLPRRDELIQGVEAEELSAGDVVNAGAPDAPHDLLHDAVGARIAVVIRIPEQPAAFADQSVVTAPGVHSDAVETMAVRLDVSQGPLKIAPQPIDVPMQGAPDARPVRSGSGRPP